VLRNYFIIIFNQERTISMQYPKKIETVHVETLDDELCIYDWQRTEVHNLNPTAAAVWQLCDGHTTPQEMGQHLKSNLNVAQAEELVWLTIRRLEQAHLLEHEVVKPAGHKMSRREILVKLGVAGVLLPVVSSIVAPKPIEAQSPVVTFGTWRPVATACSAATTPFDPLNLSASQLNADATSLCGGDFTVVVQFVNFADCATCYTAAVNAGADWYRWGASEVGNCQAHSCLGTTNVTDATAGYG